MSELEELKAVVNELRDIEAIKHLKAKYCHLVDGGRWNELAEQTRADRHLRCRGGPGARGNRLADVHLFAR